VSDPKGGLGEDLTISVERMMRFFYLSEMLFECAEGDAKVLPVHLTRFGTLLLETSSFLYSLFEDRVDSINLMRIWQGFEHPFSNQLQDYSARLSPFKQELKLVRDRLGFHGSLTRSHEEAGLGVFDVGSGRASEFTCLVSDMRQLFRRMIAWYMEGMDGSVRPNELWKEFVVEVQGHSRRQESTMLELRPTCEHCNRPLPPDSLEARICSYECTFCLACVEQVLSNVCPNCGGGFVPRPIRPATNWNGDNFLGKDPASTKVKHRPVDSAAHSQFVAKLKTIPPEKR
jgi:hypothetical protein